MARKALLVGINHSLAMQVSDLHSSTSVNVVENVASSLVALGIFPPTPGAMRILTDRQATKIAILDGFKWLVQDAKKGDLLLFHYAGPDSQDGKLDGEKQEEVHLGLGEEIIYPYDYADAGMISSKDLNAIFMQLSAGHLWMLFSTPFSRALACDNSEAVADLPSPQPGGIRNADVTSISFRVSSKVSTLMQIDQAVSS